MRPPRLIFQECHPFYYLCYEAAEALRAAENEHTSIRSKYARNKEWSFQDDQRGYELVGEIVRRVVAAPVFAVMAAEQLIYAYALERLKKYDVVLERIDRLELEAKWRLVPALACRKEFPRNSKSLSRLRKLISLRNYMTHPKPIIIGELTEEKLENFGRKVASHDRMRYAIAREAPNIVADLAQELCAIDRHSSVRKIVRLQGIPLRPKSET